MECQKAAYLEEGMSEAEVERRTVANMSDALPVGSVLDRAHRPRPQWRGMLIALSKIVLGCCFNICLPQRRAAACR